MEEEEGRVDSSPTESGSSPSSINVERTLALIKPDVVDRAAEIEDIILRSGFTILQVCNSHALYYSNSFIKFAILLCNQPFD